MKKLAAAIVAVLLCTALAGCADKTTNSNSDSSAPATAAEELPYEEEMPLKNQLISELPFPADTGTLELNEQEFKKLGFTLALPSGVNVEEADGSVNISDNGERWTLCFEPFGANEFAARRAAADRGGGDSRLYREADRVDCEVMGFKGFAAASNITDSGLRLSERSENIKPQYKLILDYGEQYSRGFSGLQITLSSADPDPNANIYELLYLRHVRAILNGIKISNSTAAKRIGSGAITAKIPAKWQPLAADDGSLTAEICDGGRHGTMSITAVKTDSPDEYVKNRAKLEKSEIFEKTYGELTYSCYVKNLISTTVDEAEAKQKHGTRIAELYTKADSSHLVRIVISYNDTDEKNLKKCLDSEVLSDVLSSVETESDKFTDSGNYANSADFEISPDGVITKFFGSGEVNIPTEINGVTVTSVGSKAFRKTNVTAVSIPPTVTEIGEKAFDSCKQLQSVNISDGLLLVDNSAFANCPKLQNMKLPSSVIYVGCKAFENSGTGKFTSAGAPYFDSRAMSYSGFDEIEIGGGELTSPRIFLGCSAKKISIGEGVTSVGRECMSECPNLSQVDLPETLAEIGKYCFSLDNSLRTVRLPSHLDILPEGCFYQTRLDSLTVPENVTGIEHYAVTSCAYLTLTNPAVRLAMEAFNTERVYIADVYLSEDMPRNLEWQYIAMQVYIPMDGNVKESENMDAYLNGLGFGEISWIGTDPDFLPADSSLFTVNEDYEITLCKDVSGELMIPHAAYDHEGNSEIYGVKAGAFKSIAPQELYINGNIERLPNNALKGCGSVTDLWFSGAVSYQLSLEGFEKKCLQGLDSLTTVHLPARIDESERESLEQKLIGRGLPSDVTFDYYSL